MNQAINKEKQNMDIVLNFKRIFYDINNREALESEIIDNLKDKLDVELLNKIIEQTNKNINVTDVIPNLPKIDNIV